MKLKKVKRSLDRRLASGVLVLVSITVPAILLVAKWSTPRSCPLPRKGTPKSPRAAFRSSSSQGEEDTASDEVGAVRRWWAGLFDVETNSGLPLLDSDHRREASSTTAPAARFDSERKRSAGRRVKEHHL